MSAECLKAAGYLDKKDQDKISYMFIQPKKEKKKTNIARPGPIYKLSTEYNQKVKVANKMKNKYLKKNYWSKK